MKIYLLKTKKVVHILNINLVISLSAVSFLSCVHENVNTSRKTANSDASPVATSDVGKVGPNGEVVLFYKDADNIIIQQCEDRTVLNQRSDCKTKSGTEVKKIPVSEFKQRLKMALTIPAGYSKDLNSKIETYNENKNINFSEVEKKIKQIEDFTARYGLDNDKLDTANELQQLKNKKEIDQIIKEINIKINYLVDQLIIQSKLEQVVFSKNKDGFEFNILQSYVKKYNYMSFENSFVEIKAGSFMMGSSKTENSEFSDEVQHQVTLTYNFELQTTPVTQSQYFEIMGLNPSFFKDQKYCPTDYLINMCPNNPVEKVSYDDVLMFVKTLNRKDQKYNYRLPTEAEFEYAARAGTQTEYWFGDDISQIGNYAWNNMNSNNQTHSVKLKIVNPWGLYDMLGNIWQYTSDFYYSYDLKNTVNPRGPDEGSRRVMRGGSFRDSPAALRSSFRAYYWPGNSSHEIFGFRLVRKPK